MTVPTLSRIVLYKVTQQVADLVNKQRRDASEHVAYHREKAVGVQIHAGNKLSEGDVYPMMIVHVWGTDENSPVNGQVFLDGSDVFWATSVSVGTEPGSFSWPVHT